MPVQVDIPNTLRDYCGDFSEIELQATSVRSALLELKQRHPALYQSVCDETDHVRRHINVFINDQFVPARDHAGLDMRLDAGDVLTIWTSVSGG